ncbi:unnamed protein product, partial [Rotaria sp. Silwood2]
MQRSHFPGYSQCIICRSLVAQKEIHNHILSCRSGSLTDYKLCTFCNQQIPIQQHQQHVETCNQQKDILSSEKKCLTCGNILDELTSYCPSCDNTGYSTPRASTPTQTIADTPEDIISLKKEKKKLCILCSKDIDQSDYENHISSCSADDYCRNDQDVPTRNTSTEKRNDEKIVPNKKQTKYCILCSKDIDQSEYEDHLVSCSTDEDRSDNQFLIDNHNKKSNENNSSSQIENYSLKEENILKKKRTKHCILCSKDIYQSDYEDHVAYCSNDNNRENFNHTSEYRRDPST